MEFPLVTVGIVTWNSEKYIKACMEGLKNQNYYFELIVVDNNSKDFSDKIVKSFFPSAHIIKNKINRGFCHGHNQAIRKSKGKYYLALNPDVFLFPYFIQNLVDELETYPEAGSATGKLLLTNKLGINRIDTTGLFIDRKRRQYLRGHGEIDEGQFDFSDEVFGTDGAAPLYRKEMLDDININGEYFDEVFFAHKEDVDVAWRARLYGWSSRYTYKATGFHDRSFRPGKRKEMSSDIKGDGVKNRYLLMIKNEDLNSFTRDFFQIIFYDFKILIFLLFLEQSSIKALLSVFSLIPDMRKKRKKIMSTKKVKTLEILNWFG